jgi:alkyl sulfatase BDS1-like metallo-beta-lactamase superfamily hydrolase
MGTLLIYGNGHPSRLGNSILNAMGDVKCVLSLAQGYIDADPPNLRFAATLLSHAVFATKGTTTFEYTARTKLAEVLEKLGYAAECGP